MKKIAILVLPQCFPTALIGLRDLFWLSTQASQFLQLPASETLEVSLLSSDGQAVVDGHGQLQAVDGSLDDTLYDMVLVPGLVSVETDTQGLLDYANTMNTWLRSQHARGAWVGGSCAGVVVLAAAGLLNQRKCTTTWWLHSDFQQRYPKACWQWGAGLQQDGRLISVGGPMSWIDIGLHSIRVLAGDKVAKATADFGVIDNSPLKQTAYVPPGFVTHQSSLLLDIESWIRARRGRVTVEELSDRFSMGKRTLARRLQLQTGETPQQVIFRIRMDMARFMLLRESIPIKQVAMKVGYDDESSFRRAFKRYFGYSPKQERSRDLPLVSGD